MPFSSVLGASSVIKPGVCTSTTRPSVPYTGQLIFETDTNLVLAWNGSSWRAISNSIATNGGVLQIATTVKSDTFTSTSTSFVDVTGLSVTITPKSSTNKILVLVEYSGINQISTAQHFFRVLRDSTAIAVGDVASNRTPVSGVFNQSDPAGIANRVVVYLDSPTTTSAITYKIQARNSAAGTLYVNRAQTDTDAATTPRTISTITVCEISA